MFRYPTEKRNPWIFRSYHHPPWYKRDSGDDAAAASNKVGFAIHWIRKKSRDNVKCIFCKMLNYRLVHVYTIIDTKNIGFQSKFLVFRDFDVRSFQCVQMDEVARILSYKISELANHMDQEEPKKSTSQRTVNGREVGSGSDEAAKQVTFMTDVVLF